VSPSFSTQIIHDFYDYNYANPKPELATVALPATENLLLVVNLCQLSTAVSDSTLA